MHSISDTPAPAAQPTVQKRPKPCRRPQHMKLDARTWQARLLRDTKAELLRHIGAAPSITQKALAERAAWLTVYIAEMDAKATAGEFMSDHAGRQYLAWSNALARTLSRLGLKSAAQQPSLKEHLAQREAKRAA